MKKTKLAGIVLWLLGICLYFYPDVATDLQEIKVQAFVKTYEREHKSRRRSVTGSRQEEYGYIQIPKMNVTLRTEQHTVRRWSREFIRYIRVKVRKIIKRFRILK